MAHLKITGQYRNGQPYSAIIAPENQDGWQERIASSTSDRSPLDMNSIITEEVDVAPKETGLVETVSENPNLKIEEPIYNKMYRQLEASLSAKFVRK